MGTEKLPLFGAIKFYITLDERNSLTYSSRSVVVSVLKMYKTWCGAAMYIQFCFSFKCVGAL